MPITVKIPLCPEVTQTLLSSAPNIHVIYRNPLTTALSTQNIIIPRLLVRRALDVPHGNILDLDAIGGVACRAAIQVVLLDIDAVDGNVSQVDVFIENVGNKTCRVGV